MFSPEFTGQRACVCVCVCVTGREGRGSPLVSAEVHVTSESVKVMLMSKNYHITGMACKVM